MSEISKWYDEYSSRQADMGINARHKSIHNWALKFGLKKSDNVLEIGCGIGTQTKLLADYLNNYNQITAIDLSPKSIEVAKQLLKQYHGINWIATDFVTYDSDKKYDFVLLPDVIEHIPLAQHKALFAKISQVISDEAQIVIHIPNPNYLEWCHTHAKDKLQVLDQPIYTDELSKNVYPSGLYIHHLQTYSIWNQDCDYQIILIRKKRDLPYTIIPKPNHVKVWNTVKRKSKSLLGKK